MRFHFNPTLIRLIVPLLLVPEAKVLASPLDYWTWSNPGVNGNTLYSIAYGNGTYVAVGDLATVLGANRSDR